MNSSESALADEQIFSEKLEKLHSEIKLQISELRQACENSKK